MISSLNSDKRRVWNGFSRNLARFCVNCGSARHDELGARLGRTKARAGTTWPIHLSNSYPGHASVATIRSYLHARPTQSSAEFIVAR